MQITAQDEQELNMLVQQYVAQGFHVESNIAGNVILKKKGYSTGVLIILLLLCIIFGLLYYILSNEQIVTITTNNHNNYNNNFSTNQNTQIPQSNNDEIEMYCVKCGSPILKDSKFCTNCGKPVETSEEIVDKTSEIKEITESNEEKEIVDNITKNTKEVVEPEVIKSNDKTQ